MAINQKELDSLEVGDSITFKALTRYSNAKATRKVTGFGLSDINADLKRTRVWVEVRYAGYGNFAVKPVEVSSILIRIRESK